MYFIIPYDTFILITLPMGKPVGAIWATDPCLGDDIMSTYIRAATHTIMRQLSEIDSHC